MLYYRVKPQFDQKRRIDGSILIANELYTVSEAYKYRIPSGCADIVNIPRNETYFFFGVRFENEKRKEESS